MLPELLVCLLCSAAVVAFVVATYQRRLRRAYSGHRRLEEYADVLLQHMQGTLLNVQGIVSELREEDPIRERVE